MGVSVNENLLNFIHSAKPHFVVTLKIIQNQTSNIQLHPKQINPAYKNPPLTPRTITEQVP